MPPVAATSGTTARCQGCSAPPAYHRLDDFLGRQAKEERHSDFVDRELENVREVRVAFVVDVRPDERGRGTQRQQQRPLEQAAKDSQHWLSVTDARQSATKSPSSGSAPAMSSAGVTARWAKPAPGARGRSRLWPRCCTWAVGPGPHGRFCRDRTAAESGLSIYFMVRSVSRRLTRP